MRAQGARRVLVDGELGLAGYGRRLTVRELWGRVDRELWGMGRSWGAREMAKGFLVSIETALEGWGAPGHEEGAWKGGKCW